MTYQVLAIQKHRFLDIHWPPDGPGLELLHFSYRDHAVIWHDRGPSLHPALTVIDCSLPTQIPTARLLLYIQQQLCQQSVIVDIWRTATVFTIGTLADSLAPEANLLITLTGTYRIVLLHLSESPRPQASLQPEEARSLLPGWLKIANDDWPLQYDGRQNWCPLCRLQAPTPHMRNQCPQLLCQHCGTHDHFPRNCPQHAKGGTEPDHPASKRAKPDAPTVPGVV